MCADASALSVPPPLVSVVIPTRNRADFLSEAIKSVLQQDYVNIEIFICDNASTDHTGLVVGNYAKEYPNVHYIRNEQDIGLINNFNQCVQVANGEYIFRFADDDLISPRYISLLVDELSKHPAAIAAIGAVSLMTTEGEPIHAFSNFEQMHVHGTQGMSLLERAIHYLRYGHYEGWAWAVVYGIFRTDVLKQLQMSSELKDPGALFVLSVFLKGELACCKEGAVTYKRQGGASNVFAPPKVHEILAVFLETNKSSWMTGKLVLDSIKGACNKARIFPWIVLFMFKQFISSVLLAFWVGLKIILPWLNSSHLRHRIRKMHSGWGEKH